MPEEQTSLLIAFTARNSVLCFPLRIAHHTGLYDQSLR